MRRALTILIVMLRPKNTMTRALLLTNVLRYKHAGARRASLEVCPHIRSAGERSSFCRLGA